MVLDPSPPPLHRSLIGSGSTYTRLADMTCTLPCVSIHSVTPHTQNNRYLKGKYAKYSRVTCTRLADMTGTLPCISIQSVTRQAQNNKYSKKGICMIFMHEVGRHRLADMKGTLTWTYRAWLRTPRIVDMPQKNMRFPRYLHKVGRHEGYFAVCQHIKRDSARPDICGLAAEVALGTCCVVKGHVL